ncbi:hypothetical protein CPB83DRAFT_846184 [Crepidotus variabilis]|uniref:Transmembrane protein n=1 Tax=Crepidotus variabilis TaxID=179855 RepID=A0A9P6JUT0_9AGAR|nr:hypothetical protein CPB83DRAFT_846184 [Crepidotus variabilis]
MSANPPAVTLPNSLNLPPHLSAHKYFLVCTLTVAAWDTLVLSPRTWRLIRTPGWPALKILFNFLRVFMPAEFIVVAVAFFNSTWPRSACDKFYLFEPICTAILLAATSAVHVIRINAIYEHKRPVLGLMSGLYALQIVVTAISCGFYLSVPLLPEQGCIAGPKATWVGIYWIAPTLLYTASLGLALYRSIASRKIRPISGWKLMLRDGLNLYGAIWLVNMVNVCFWFIMKPKGKEDPIKTIVTSMAAVLTTSMTLRIILSVRGPLERGGSFALSASTGTSSNQTHGISAVRSGNHPTHISTNPNNQTYTLEDLSKRDAQWGVPDDSKSSVPDEDGVKPAGLVASPGVKVTMDREIVYDDQDSAYRRK